MLIALTTTVSAQRGEGVVSGQVVDGVTGKPVSAAVVAVGGPSMLGWAPENQVPGVLTDRDGRFAFRNLPPGTFSITVSKGGYAEGEPGRRRPGGSAPPIVLAAAAMTADVVVPMWHFSTIAGAVIDEAGEPVVGLQVRALGRASGQGPRATAATTFTDDRGAYRFGTLMPGDYLLVASPAEVSANAGIVDTARTGQGTGPLAALADRRTMTTGPRVGSAVIATGRSAVPPPPAGHHLQVYPPTFYPSALAPAQASAVAVGAGEERSAVDIQIVPTPTARVSGTLLDAGSPAATITMRLIPAGTDTVPADVVAPVSVTDGDGEFVFAGVAPGRYALRASTGGGRSLGWVDTPLTVGSDDLDNVVVTLSPALRVAGRSRFEGSAPPPPPIGSTRFTTAPFSLEAVDSLMDGLSVAAMFGEDGTFTMLGYLPGRYRVRVVTPPRGWMLKGALLDGVDVSETPFELKKDVADLTLVFTDRPSGVSGRVDGATADASVLLFTADPSAWNNAGPYSRRFRSTRVTASGAFAVSEVPAGDYFVVAVPEEQTVDWRDPSRLPTLAALATLVSIAEGEMRPLALRLKDPR